MRIGSLRLGNQSVFNRSALNGSVFGKLRMDEAGNHRAIHLFGDICICAELHSECSDFADDLFHALRCSHVVGRFLERSCLLDVSATLGQTADGGEAWLAERRGRWIMGTPEQALERVRALEANGTQRIMLQDFVPRDLDHVRLMGKIFTA